MDYIQIPISEWAPDQGDFNNNALVDANNVIPEAGYFRCMKGFVSISSALTPNPQTGFWAERSDGTRFTFAGTDNGIFRINSSAGWDDVSNGVMSAASNWRFAKFGERVLAVAAGFAPQYYDMAGVPTSTTFTNLGGSPPSSATDVAVVRDFVVMARPSGERLRIQWSGFNNSEIWGDITRQADFQDFKGRIGRVQRVISGDYGLVFCEHAIFRMDYVGPPNIFSFTEIDRGRGTPAADSVCTSGRMVFFYGHEGFFVNDGHSSTPIGYNVVDRYFRSSVSPNEIQSMRGAVDRKNKLVVWIYKTGASTNYDRAIIYNWGANAWSGAEINTLGIFENIDAGYNLDTLDTLFPGGIDTSGLSVDDQALTGGSLELAAFDTSKQLVTFSGAPLNSTFETADLVQGDMLNIEGVRPEISGNNISFNVAVGGRNLLSSSVAYTQDIAPDPYTGMSGFNVTTRYPRFRVRVSGDVSHAKALTVLARKAGRK